MYADGFAPRELDVMVVDEHPTLLNVTLFPSKVGGSLPSSRRPWQPPWLAAPRPRPEPEVVGGAGERGDRPYAYSPIGDTPIRWRDGYNDRYLRTTGNAPFEVSNTFALLLCLNVGVFSWC